MAETNRESKACLERLNILFRVALTAWLLVTFSVLTAAEAESKSIRLRVPGVGSVRVGTRSRRVRRGGG